MLPMSNFDVVQINMRDRVHYLVDTFETRADADNLINVLVNSKKKNKVLDYSLFFVAFHGEYREGQPYTPNQDSV